MIKIYVHNKPLFLVNQINGEVAAILQHQDTIFFKKFSLPNMELMLNQLGKADTRSGVFLHKDVGELLESVKAHSQLIVAAGGLVYTADNHVLLIYRRGKWDLPKGKLDAGESLEDCAVREISEETGATGLQLEKPLIVTYHTYKEGTQLILKESHWYLLRAATKLELSPQIEEDIQQCIWVPVDKLPDYRDDMHASIVDVVDAGLILLQHTDQTK